ncbi:MAG: hypothetical protein FVQ82_05800 [Planctomycetes bacterium]|nr:hypothetical protein [Planctomycetota bacterium]
MTTFLRVSVLFVTLSALTVFTGCSKKSDNWLIGKWGFDSETTKANLPPNIKAQGVPDSMAEKMGAQLVTQLMNQMNNIKFHITAEKITSISGIGAGKSSTYKIIERPDANTIVAESKDGEVSTFIKSGKYICIPSTGAVQFKMYFKPVN